MIKTSTRIPNPTDSDSRIEEMGQVILAYSEVVEQLQKSQAELRQSVEKLRSELTEKNRQLARRERLAALGEMAAGIAHELRNPLGGIQLSAELLADDLADQPQQRQHADRIRTGVRRLEAVVGSTLNLTRGVTPTLRACCLREVAQAAADAAGFPVELELPDMPSLMRADPQLLAQALLNLLRNAHEAGGPVTLRLRDRRLTVLDRGPGFSAEQRRKAFDPFFTTKATGTGLGLALTHQIAAAHDGHVTLTNRQAGGAAVTLDLTPRIAETSTAA
jgi:signal transduction histidine kinase